MKIKNAVYYIICYILKFVSLIFYPCTAIGLNNLPKEGPFIICPNHISMFDIIALNMVRIKPMRYMAKAELFKNKIFGGILGFFGAFPVNRGKNDKTAVRSAENMLRSNEPMCIFIEGTRTKSKEGTPGRAKSGAVLIASTVGCDIIPVAIVYKHGRPRIFAKTYVYFGNPIKSDELKIVNGDRNEIRSAADKIMSNITEMWKAGTENCRR